MRRSFYYPYLAKNSSKLANVEEYLGICDTDDYKLAYLRNLLGAFLWLVCCQQYLPIIQNTNLFSFLLLIVKPVQKIHWISHIYYFLSNNVKHRYFEEEIADVVRVADKFY
jgi:hypothetical protein